MIKKAEKTAVKKADKKAEEKIEKKVRFELSAPAAARVAVTGDFNRWDKNGIALTKGKNGTWTTELSLKPGKYQYKFIADGEWKTDPLNKFSVPNAFGTENSVKEVI